MKQLVKTSLKAGTLLFMVAVILNTGCQQNAPDYSKELKPIRDKLVDAWNGGSLDALDPLFDANFIRKVNQQPDVFGVEGFKKAITDFRTAYPDLKLTLDNEIYSENAMAARWAITGTNTGPGAMPPTGKAIKFWGETILRFSNRKITGEIVAYDNQALMEQLGFTMTPPSEETN